MPKMIQLSPKRKARGLVFGQILVKNIGKGFYVDFKKAENRQMLCKKLCAEVEAFAEFWSKISISDYEWGLKCGQNGPIIAKK